MKTHIEVHNGIPLGVPREWTDGKKSITHNGAAVGSVWLLSFDTIKAIFHLEKSYLRCPNQTAALEWIAKQIKETEE